MGFGRVLSPRQSPVVLGSSLPVQTPDLDCRGSNGSQVKINGGIRRRRGRGTLQVLVTLS